jgi:DHA3 family tetracycline resistance protein-like MFS transporter
MRRMDAGRTYLVYSASSAVLFLLTFTIYSVFAITRLGLDPLQLVLLGSVLELTYLLAEVPTGVVADLVSRRLSVIIGVVGSGAAFVLLGLSQSFWPAAISQVIWGIAAAFQAGADVAWITDEFGEENARPYYLRAGQVGNAGALVGIVASVILASIDLALPILVTGAGLILLGIWLAVFMPEDRFTRYERPEGERFRTGFGKTFRDGVHQVRAHHVLLLVLATAALHGASTEGFDRLADYHLIRDIGLPPIGDLDRVVWFGLLGAASLVLGIGARRS